MVITDITVRIVADTDELTCGLLEEYEIGLKYGAKMQIFLASTTDGRDNIVGLWLPTEGRAGLSCTHNTGNDQWTDASSIEDAVLRYENNDMNP